MGIHMICGQMCLQYVLSCVWKFAWDLSSICYETFENVSCRKHHLPNRKAQKNSLRFTMDAFLKVLL